MENILQIKYAVIDHNSMWGWPLPKIKTENADVIFIFNDFLFKKNVLKWQSQDKKVIVFEHGWNSFFDYELNKQNFLADGYMALGKNTADSLVRAGVKKKRILITGNPHFDNLKTGKKDCPIPNVIYTALHWFGDTRDYNNKILNKIIKVFNPYTNISVKIIADSHINIPKKIKSVWYSEIAQNKNLFKDIAKGLADYDIILTPKESTFDFIALLVGKKVFRISEEKEYRKEGQQHSRNILPLSEISTDLLLQDSRINVNLEDEIIPSLNIKEILNWVETLK